MLCFSIFVFFLFFFFKQKTAYEMRISDWSSDVCSSDLRVRAAMMAIQRCDLARGHQIGIAPGGGHHHDVGLPAIAAEIADIGDAEHVAVALKIGRAACRERVCQYV